ncbi:expressed protein [Phakopsora pachyrhizi]|uniref:Expressed protein n=1 Tax=Phakopsora pachyrhizi TaxID=170000 RepID=A0AAV0AHH6_PHAPC|nr:expressed protein [Phakopsora pachyrhizi]
MYSIRFNPVTLLSFLFVFSIVHSTPMDSLVPSNYGLRPTGPYTAYPKGGDHPDWKYLNQREWYKIDATQQDHARFHSYLSMSIYGDYNKTCPQTFTQGYKIIQSFSNFYVAYIPEMDKIVVVFKGPGDYDNFDWYPVSISDIVSDCQYCMTARGVKNAYLEMSRISNNFDIAKKWAKFKKVKFSVTGFGIGGCIAALSALDLGAKDEVHYSHNQGMPRCFNYAAVYKYGNLFQSLSGQSLVNKNDYRVHVRMPNSFSAKAIVQA